MQVVDEITGKLIDYYSSARVVVNHIPGKIVYGYVNNLENIISVYIWNEGDFGLYRASKTLMQDKLIFSKKRGFYMSSIDMTDYEMLIESSILGNGEFPYSFNRNYEAVNNFLLFANKQEILENKSNVASNFINYSFGIEFETSQGYIPEDLCFRDGLIPLRDGSISGLEYSTIILNGNDGFNLLKQQLNTLKEYTNFNKECSLHIHFGNFPLDPEAIFRVYYLFYNLQSAISELVPEYTFISNEYKQNGKNYCKKLPKLSNFNDLYRYMVGRNFYGDLYQGHPRDIERKRKWNIDKRYYAVNFINILCYNINKTIEFRFLRPTYNYNKILIWIYIFNAILRYAETITDLDYYRNISIRNVINTVYPAHIASAINNGINLLKVLTINQHYNSDSCGSDIILEDRIFNKLDKCIL